MTRSCPKLCWASLCPSLLFNRPRQCNCILTDPAAVRAQYHAWFWTTKPSNLDIWLPYSWDQNTPRPSYSTLSHCHTIWHPDPTHIRLCAPSGDIQVQLVQAPADIHCFHSELKNHGLDLAIISHSLVVLVMAPRSQRRHLGCDASVHDYPLAYRG